MKRNENLITGLIMHYEDIALLEEKRDKSYIVKYSDAPKQAAIKKFKEAKELW